MSNDLSTINGGSGHQVPMSAPPELGFNAVQQAYLDRLVADTIARTFAAAQNAQKQNKGEGDQEQPPALDNSRGPEHRNSVKRQRSPGHHDDNDTAAPVKARKAARREKANPRTPAPRQEAKIKQLASDGHLAPRSDVADNILKRIKKCLDRANHPSTPEGEAKAALSLSSMLMRQFNVTTADLLAQEKEENRERYGGTSVVSIRSTKGHDHRVVKQLFAGRLAHAMTIFFNCKAFWTSWTAGATNRIIKIDWSFCGIVENTVTAAIAFEMAHNRILDWARSYKGISVSFSYCCGVAEGLVSMAKKEKKKEKEEARQKDEETLTEREREEEAQRQRELERLKVRAEPFCDDSISNSPASPHKEDEPSQSESEPDRFSEYSFEYDEFYDWGDDSQDDDGGDSNIHREDSPEAGLEPDSNLGDGETLDLSGDLHEEIHQELKREKSPMHLPESIRPESQQDKNPNDGLEHNAGNIAHYAPWASETQLVRFRETAEEIAQDILKANNVKFSKRKGKTTVVKDGKAFRQGKKDSEKIDVHQKLVE